MIITFFFNSNIKKNSYILDYFHELNLRLIYFSLTFFSILLVNSFYANEFIIYNTLNINENLKSQFINYFKLSFLILKISDILILPLISSLFLTIYLCIPVFIWHFFFFLLTGLYRFEIKYYFNLIKSLTIIHLYIIPLLYKKKFTKFLIIFFQLFFLNNLNLYTINIQPELFNYIIFFFQLYCFFYILILLPVILIVNQYFKQKISEEGLCAY